MGIHNIYTVHSSRFRVSLGECGLGTVLHACNLQASHDSHESTPLALQMRMPTQTPMPVLLQRLPALLHYRASVCIFYTDTVHARIDMDWHL